MAGSLHSVDLEHPNPRLLQRAVAALVEGELVAYPTDTYYGMGCDPASKRAIDRLYALKGRDRKKPLALLCPDLSQVARYARVTNFAYRLMKHLTPGPYTFILEATRLVPQMLTTKQKEVGIRVPDSDLVRSLASDLGRPLVTTSASGRDGQPLTDAREIRDTWGHALALILDAGVTLSEPSTVISLVHDEIDILREGKGMAEITTIGRLA